METKYILKNIYIKNEWTEHRKISVEVDAIFTLDRNWNDDGPYYEPSIERIVVSGSTDNIMPIMAERWVKRVEEKVYAHYKETLGEGAIKSLEEFEGWEE